MPKPSIVQESAPAPEVVESKYFDWCLRMVELHWQARQGYQAFIEANGWECFDTPLYRQKAWVPFPALKQFAESMGLPLPKAIALRQEYRHWVEAVRWSDPERVHSKLISTALEASPN